MWRNHAGLKERAPSSFAIIVLVLSVIFIAYELRPLLFQVVWEDAAMVIQPTAARAYAYGVRHFDAEASSEYDVIRAERLFRTAARLDPNTPYVYHELARIEFLRGNFETALQLIDHEIEKAGDTNPNAFYVRGLIEGYMGKYDDAASDYSVFLKTDPNNWAAINDYAWVLLKAGRAMEAQDVLAHGVIIHPENAWLLNSYTIALFEIGDLEAARQAASHAIQRAAAVTQDDWLHAYPGNDPKVAAQGIAVLQQAATDNMNRVESAIASAKI